MGIFSQDKTSTNQTSYNQQLGISTRDVTGAQLTSGGGSVSSFGNAGLSVGGGGSSAIYTQGGGISVGGGGTRANITVNQSLDATALNTAAALVNNALTSNTQATQSALQGFQNALSVSGEQSSGGGGSGASGQVTPLATTTSVGTPGILGSIGINGKDLVLIGLTAAALFIYLRVRK